MATLFMTGFEAGSLAVMDYTAGGGSVSSTRARTGTYSLRLSSGISSYSYKGITSSAELWGRFGLYLSGGTDIRVFSVYDSSASLQLEIRVVGGYLVLYRGATQIATGTMLLSANQWYCLEWHFKIADVGGQAQVKIDGTLDIDFSGDTCATSTANIARIQFGSSSTATIEQYIDDVVVDNAGWVGRGGIYGLVPNGAGTYTQLSASSGSNYQCVDEVPPNDDTDYVYSSTVDAKDTYAMSNLSVTSGTVRAVQWLARAKLSATGSGNIARLLRINGTDYQGSDTSLDTSYRYVTEIFDTNPNTGTAWTISNVNDLEAGVVVR